MREGQADEVASWVAQLEDDAGVSPIWEVLFQLMCCPVPQVRHARRAVGMGCRVGDGSTAGFNMNAGFFQRGKLQWWISILDDVR
jgi:hypothetical protein